MDNTWDPMRMDVPKKRKALLRIQMEEEYETGEVDNVDESDPDVIRWRSLHAEDKVQELISRKIIQNRDKRKLDKFKRYLLEDAEPDYRRILLEYYGMPPEDHPIIGSLKSAIASVSSLVSAALLLNDEKQNLKKET